MAQWRLLRQHKLRHKVLRIAAYKLISYAAGFAFKNIACVLPVNMPENTVLNAVFGKKFRKYGFFVCFIQRRVMQGGNKFVKACVFGGGKRIFQPYAFTQVNMPVIIRKRFRRRQNPATRTADGNVAAGKKVVL